MTKRLFMPKRRLFPFLVLATVLAAGCGGEPGSRGGQGFNRSRSRPSPTPFPTRSVPSRGFDASKLETEFNVSYSGPNWVQVVDRQLENTWYVVGIVPTESGGDLEAQVESHRQEFSTTPGSKHLESGVLDSKVLGRMMWSLGSFDDGNHEMDQLVLFAAHPEDGCLIVARTEFQAADAQVQPRLDQMVAITEIVGPGL
jgi:hypothetical protein